MKAIKSTIVLTLMAVLGLAAESVARDGPAVLLRNGQVVYGKAREEADRIVIEDNSAIFRLYRHQVLCWADNVESLYQYRVDHRMSGSSQQHLADAQWCINNGLLTQAAAELRALRDLSGDSAAADALEKRLRVLAEQKANESPAESPPASKQSDDSSTTSDFRSEKPTLRMITHGEKPALGPSNLESAETVHRFTEAIQPMLLNRCATAGCHGMRAAAAPKLDGWRFGVTAKITAENLHELGLLIDPKNPGNSRLLEMAGKPHGGSEALSGKLDWQLRERLIDWVYLSANVERPIVTLAPESDAAALPLAESDSKVAPAAFFEEASPASSTLPTIPKSPPKRLPEVLDPFDPEVFNRSFR